jgi:hypothetical protein
MRLGLQFGIEFGAECCTLLPSHAVGELVYSWSGFQPPRVRNNPTNAQHSQSEFSTDRATAASKHSVIPPAVSGEVNGLVQGHVVRWLRLANPGNDAVLDPLTPRLASRSIEGKAVPDQRREQGNSRHSLSLMGSRGVSGGKNL